MDDFKEALEKQMKKATTPGTARVPVIETEDPVEREPAIKIRHVRSSNRLTVQLFETDKRALAVIKELLGAAGYDFTSRSDSIKVGLRLATKAKPEELASLYQQVKAEDGRFRP